MLSLGFAVVVVLVSSLFASGNTLQCPNVTDEVELPPMNSSHFHYKIQITIPGLNKTLDGYEYYDSTNGRTFLKTDHEGGSAQVVLDYKHNQTFVVQGTNCAIRNLTGSQSNQSLFGMGIEKGPLHVKYAFVWGKEYNVSKSNKTVNIDGIATDHYKTCLSFENGSIIYNVDIYFSQTNWSMPAAQNAPVLLRLNATVEKGNKTSSQIYIFKFSDYHTTSVPKTLLPSGMVCKGRKDSPKKPAPGPKAYRVGNEFILHDPYATGSFMIYSDFNNKLFRMDIGNNKTVHNFKEGISFQINKTSGSCKASKLPTEDSFFDLHPVKVGNKTYVNMVDPSHFWNKLDPVYGGQLYVRDVLCDSWIAQKPVVKKDFYFGGVKAYIYFTYYISAVAEHQNAFVGLHERLIVTKEKEKKQYNETHFVDIMTFDFSLDVQISDFDVSSCFNTSQKETVSLKFSKDVGQAAEKNPNNFKEILLNEVAKSSNVSLYRVNSEISYEFVMETDSDKNNKTYFYVFVTLLGVSDVKGNSEDMESQTDLKTAVNMLKSVVTNSHFIIKLNGQPSAAHPYFKSVKDLLVPKIPPPSPPNPPAPSKGWSDGAIAGIAIGMVVLGILIGVGVMIYRGKRASNGYAYTMQD